MNNKLLESKTQYISIMNPFYQNKISKATKIIETVKDEIWNICWNDDRDEYCNFHDLIPWLHEEAQYDIARLNLEREDELYYLQILDQVVGEFLEIA